MRTFVFLAFAYASGNSDPCGGKSFSDFPPYTTLYTYDEAVACLRSIPARKDWINSTLDTLESGLQNFAFLDKMKNSGPPYNIRSDFLGSLDALRGKAYTYDVDFQEDVQILMTRMHDAHTQYIKPACYHATFLAPFSLRSELKDGRQAIIVEANSFEKVYQEYWGVKLSPYYGRELLAIDDLEVMTFIGNFAEDQETISNDLSAAFNSAIRTVMYRNQFIFPRPKHHEMKLTFRVIGSDNDDLQTFSFPWLVMGDGNFGKASACAKTKGMALQAPRSCRTWREQEELCMFTKTVPSPMFLTSGAQERRSVTILPDGRGSTISCFTQRNTSGVALFMKVRSFEPDSTTNFVDDLLTCLQTPFDVVIIDVMQNGGGSIDLGYKLATLLVEEFHKNPTKALYKYDIKHSSLMDAFVRTMEAQSPFGDADGAGVVLDPQTLKAFSDDSWYTKAARHFRGGILGNYSQPFVWNFSETFAYRSDQKPYKFPKPSELFILSDGTCGSTCATFSLVMNEQKLATTVGVGGISQYTMAVSSFAGGSVSNMDNLAEIGGAAGMHVPQFLTTAIWQFTFMEVYSKVYVNTPAQFVMEPPTIRISWWDFPHPSVPASVSQARLGELYSLALREAERLNAETSIVLV